MKKKAGLVIGAAGAVFAYAVWKKMQEPHYNKDTIKGKVKEFAGDKLGNDNLRTEGIVDQLVGGSKDVIRDITDNTTQFVDKMMGAGSSDQLKGHAEEMAGKMAHDPMKKAEGKVDQAMGKTKAFSEGIKEKAAEKLNHPHDTHHPKH